MPRFRIELAQVLLCHPCQRFAKLLIMSTHFCEGPARFGEVLGSGGKDMRKIHFSAKPKGWVMDRVERCSVIITNAWKSSSSC